MSRNNSSSSSRSSSRSYSPSSSSSRSSSGTVRPPTSGAVKKPITPAPTPPTPEVVQVIRPAPEPVPVPQMGAVQAGLLGLTAGLLIHHGQHHTTESNNKKEDNMKSFDTTNYTNQITCIDSIKDHLIGGFFNYDEFDNKSACTKELNDVTKIKNTNNHTELLDAFDKLAKCICTK